MTPTGTEKTLKKIKVVGQIIRSYSKVEDITPSICILNFPFLGSLNYCQSIFQVYVFNSSTNPQTAPLLNCILKWAPKLMKFHEDLEHDSTSISI